MIQSEERGFPGSLRRTFCEVLWITLHVMDTLWKTLELMNIPWVTFDVEISCSLENEPEIPTIFCRKKKSLFNHYLESHSFSLLLCSKAWSEEDQTPLWLLLTPLYFHKGPSGSQAPGSSNRHHGDGHESEWTPGVGDGQGGLACCDSWGPKESDTTERLDWTELNWGGIYRILGFLVGKMGQPWTWVQRKERACFYKETPPPLQATWRYIFYSLAGYCFTVVDIRPYEIQRVWALGFLAKLFQSSLIYRTSLGRKNTWL